VRLVVPTDKKSLGVQPGLLYIAATQWSGFVFFGQSSLAANVFASLVAYLSSDLSIATNGAAVRADGGVVKSAF
jgi:hypothetical protein